MSFLADDEFSTLEAALAFIDSYQDRSIDVLAAASRAPAPATATTHALPAPPVTPPSTTTSGSESADADADSEGSPRSDERSEDGEPQGDAVVRRRKARNALASARSHRKKREELLLLREQETLLQAQLDALKARQQTTSGTQSLLTAMQAAGGVDGREGAVVPAGGAQLLPSAHFDLALHEHRRRQKSEALNRRLRTALRKQRSLSQHFSQHIHKRLEFKDVMEVLQLSERSRSALSPIKVNPRTPNASRIAVQKEAILDELMVKMRQQFREADAACEIAALDESSSSNMQVKQHPQFGAYVEITCSTPLGCTVEEAWEEFYGSMCVMKAEHANDYTFKMSVIDDQSSEKEYSISFEDKARFGVVPIDGVTLVQQFKAPDYVMYMFMSVIRPQLDGIQFRECGFIAMTRSALDPRRCIYRQQYQLFSDGPQDAGEASVALKNFLLNSLASKMRKDQRRLEDSLLQRFNASLPLVPPLA